ncbi:MAG: S58 family peptidase, partial [Bacteroidetes bacterium]|nr:S58 family peptidase [Bacteroidota bacterium]
MLTKPLKNACLLAALLLSTVQSFGQKPRARDIGIPFEGTPGQWNAITDVPGVEVG